MLKIDTDVRSDGMNKTTSALPGRSREESGHKSIHRWRQVKMHGEVMWEHTERPAHKEGH